MFQKLNGLNDSGERSNEGGITQIAGFGSVAAMDEGVVSIEEDGCGLFGHRVRIGSRMAGVGAWDDRKPRCGVVQGAGWGLGLQPHGSFSARSGILSLIRSGRRFCVVRLVAGRHRGYIPRPNGRIDR